MIVLDTSVLSELMKPAPADAVTRWFGRWAPARLYTTAITESEILHGIMLLTAGKRRNAFQAAAQAMFGEDFAGRILPFDSPAAHAYALIAASRARSGKPISHFDAQIAAIAHSAGASIATRNVRDFDDCDVEVIDPWES